MDQARTASNRGGATGSPHLASSAAPAAAPAVAGATTTVRLGISAVSTLANAGERVEAALDDEVARRLQALEQMGGHQRCIEGRERRAAGGAAGASPSIRPFRPANGPPGRKTPARRGRRRRQGQ